MHLAIAVGMRLEGVLVTTVLHCVIVDEKVDGDMGAVEDNKEQIRTTPLSLPPNFFWEDISLDDEGQVGVAGGCGVRCDALLP